MIKLTFEMKPYDFRNAKNIIGPFHLDDDIEEKIYFDIIDELEFGLFGVGMDGFRYEERNDGDYIVIDNRISYELECNIKSILGQDEDDE